ncbi:tetratricopeptide repeat protein [Nonomuraea typhae]|uniref:tetratricopeptide repeat protein n=1 Tax=Nonomuraea typhae TaxID=2603600 RepID=UPI0015E1FAB1|nr:tetratricopeptide repeat protein [Nonomuraea typhae]
MSTETGLQRARALLDLGRGAEAARELYGVLAEEPEHPVAHAYLALALRAQRRYAEAAASAAEAIRLAPDHWFGHYVAAQVHLAAGQAGPALPAADAALALNPDWAPLWELRARILLSSGRPADAADAARRALALDPEDPDPAALLAMALTQLGRGAEALGAARDALRLDPESPNAHLALGRAELAHGDPARAAGAFREVLRLAPGFDDARDLLVVALKRRNPLYRALDRFRGRYRGGWRLVLLLPAVPPLIVVFVVIAVAHWAAWLAEAWATLRLHLGARTRLLLAGSEARVAVLCWSLCGLGLAALVAGIALGHEPLGTAGVAVMALVTPVQEAAHTSARAGRAVLYGWAALLALAAAVSAALPAGQTPGLLCAYAALATIWVATLARRLTRA